MEAVISDMSALAYWRNHSFDASGCFLPRNLEPKRRGVPVIDAPSKALADDIASWTSLDRNDLHLLVSSPDKRRVIHGVTCSVCSTAVPKGSFVRALGTAYVVAPELLFIQLARHLSLAELLRVGYELCGTYRLDGEAPHYGVDPITSVSKLKSYAQRATDLPGSAKALQATKWLAEGSGSPAETALAIMFTLPYRYGGYNLGSPLLNHRIVLNDTAAHIMGRPSMRPDLFWQDAKHPVEYDGPLYHSTREQAEYDERRRNAYAAMGMSVTVVTSRHLCNLDLLDEVVAIIRKNTGIRQRKLPASYAIEHYALFTEVFEYWTALKSEHPDNDEFALMAARYAAPAEPW